MEDVNNRSFLGRGWGFPPTFNKVTHRLEMVDDEKDIHQSILILLKTTPGERPMNPSFGCDLQSQVFNTINSNTLARIKNLIKKAILLYEPRVDVKNIDIDDSKEAEGRLDINIEYQVRSINSRMNMVFPFYYREGTNIEEK